MQPHKSEALLISEGRCCVSMRKPTIGVKRSKFLGAMSQLRMGWMAPAPNCVAMRQSADAIICQEGSRPMQVTTIGLDLAKDVFQVHGITADGAVVFNRSIRRRQVLAFFKQLPPCLVGIEACGSAHHRARELQAIGHDVRLMPAFYVKPYVKRGKTDAVDAEAICEAVTRPTMRFVPVKGTDQQALLAMHRVRNLFVRQKTQVLNVIRGLLREFGHVVGNGPVAAMRFVKSCQVGELPDIPDLARGVLTTLCDQVMSLVCGASVHGKRGKRQLLGSSESAFPSDRFGESCCNAENSKVPYLAFCVFSATVRFRTCSGRHCPVWMAPALQEEML